MQDGQPGKDAPSRVLSSDQLYSLSIDEVADIYEEAGFSRTPRAIQRYCALAKLDCHKVETSTGEKYLVAPYSVERHIKYIKEVYRPAPNSRGNSRPDATVRRLEIMPATDERQTATDPDKSGPVATVREENSRYMSALERENEFLRSEMGVKNTQIADLTERARETNHLIAGLQKLFSLPERQTEEEQRP